MRGTIVVVGFVAGLAVAIGLVALTIAAIVPTCVSCVAKQREPFVVDAPGLSLALTAPSRIARVDVDIPTTTPHGPRTLRGTLSLPDVSDECARAGQAPPLQPCTSRARASAAILLHGSGPAKRSGDSPGDIVRTYRAPIGVLTQLDDVLAKQGIIVLRWDKRACMPCYPGIPWDEESFTYNDFVQDARDALAFLRARDDVDASQLIVMGHSEGGGLALELIDEPGVIGVVSLAGLLEGFDAGLVGQFDRAASVRAQQADLFGAAGFLASGWNYERCFAADEESCVGGGVSHRAQRAYIESSRKATDRLRASRVPILALMGSADRNVNPDLFEELARARINKRIRWHYVANADHALMDIEREVLHDDVVRAIDSWLRAADGS